MMILIDFTAIINKNWLTVKIFKYENSTTKKLKK
jgi:hypothetical protein